MDQQCFADQCTRVCKNIDDQTGISGQEPHSIPVLHSFAFRYLDAAKTFKNDTHIIAFILLRLGMFKCDAHVIWKKQRREPKGRSGVQPGKMLGCSDCRHQPAHQID